MKLHNPLALAVSLACAALSGAAGADTLVVDGTLYKQAGGTTFDTWKLDVRADAAFTVDLMAYEASQSNVATAGYYAADLNGDGELTWLDPDTYFYRDTGNPLAAADALVRCDDTANNCAVYQNGLAAATSPVVVASHLQTEPYADGSVHFRRDPWFEVSAAAGNYLYLVADYRLDPAEAAGGINASDSFSAPTGFASPVLDHADYRITFSSATANFSLAGDTITVTPAPVPVPAAVWLLGSALAGLAGAGRRRRGSAGG